MKYESAIDGEEMKISLSEKLTFEDHDGFRDLLESVTASASKRCVFDLSDLQSIDSAGLGMLMIAHETSERDDWKLVLSGPKGQVGKMLELTEFDKVMSIVPA